LCECEIPLPFFQGSKVITASSDKTCRIWDTSNGECINVLEGHTDEIFSCAFNYSGDTIITGFFSWQVISKFFSSIMACVGSKDNTCKIWKNDEDEKCKKEEGKKDDSDDEEDAM